MIHLPPDLVEQLALARLRRPRLDPEEMRTLALILAGVLTMTITLLCTVMVLMKLMSYRLVMAA